MRARRLVKLPSKPKARRVFQVIGLFWKDAVFSDEVERPQPADMLTIGFLVSENPEQISVAHEIDTDSGEFRGVTAVPRGMVQKVVKLGRPVSITYDA